MNRKVNKNKKLLSIRKIDLKINDVVKIIAGDDKGMQGNVLSVNRYTGKVQVSGISKRTRYTKGENKSIVQVESFIDVSNVKKVHENGV